MRSQSSHWALEAIQGSLDHAALVMPSASCRRYHVYVCSRPSRSPISAKDALGWEPKLRTPELVKTMVDAPIALLDDERSGRLVRIDS
jgi:hypothetical protein